MNKSLCRALSPVALDGAYMKKVKKSVWITILIISILIIAGAAFFLIRYLTQQDISREDFAPAPSPTAAVTEAPTQAAPTEQPTERGPITAWGYTLAELGDFDVDFDELSEINPDVYAWIYIPDTNVDYPVAQSIRDRDDSFYLSHNIYRQYQFSGTIYSEVQNHTDFHDRVTVLYGHNMLNGSMFASLHKFEDESFFNENNTMFIITKDKLYTYLIYSAYTYDDRHILNSFFFDDDKVFEEYLSSTLNPHTYNGHVREGVELTTSDRILTLSTCTNGPSNTRYLVQGVLADERSR